MMNITSSNDDTAQVDDGFWQCSSSSDSDDGEFEQGVREEGDVRQREEGMGVGATDPHEKSLKNVHRQGQCEGTAISMA
jgi:hypothetical protein